MSLAIIILGAPVFAGDQPDWVTSPKKENSTFKFYIGRSSNSPNESAAFNEAFQNALEQAIQENFGFATAVQKDTYEAMDKVSSTTRIQEISGDHIIKGFEVESSHIETTGNGKFNVWVLYKYRKSEVEAEKIRIATQRKEEKALTFNEGGNAGDKTKGGLQVVTNPPGGEVLIDGKPLPFLVTPLRMWGIPRGHHTIRIEHKKYEAVEQDLIVTPGNLSKINKLLLKATGTISVSSNPSGANVIVNGRPAGVTPIQDLKVPAGEELKIELSHPEAESTSKSIEVEGGEVRELPIELTLKPAYIVALVTSPAGAKIEIDGEERGMTPLRKPIKVTPAQAITITLEKNDYVSETKEITLRGGERRVIPTFKLTRMSEQERKDREATERHAREEAEKQAALRLMGEFQAKAYEKEKEDEYSRVFNYPWKFSVLLSYPLVAGFYFEKQLSLVGLGLGFCSIDYFVSLPIFLKSFPSENGDSLLQLYLLSEVGQGFAEDGSYLRRTIGLGFQQLLRGEPGGSNLSLHSFSLGVADMADSNSQFLKLPVNLKPYIRLDMGVRF